MKNGLEDVVAAETQLSHVNGEAGQLIIRGVSLDHLVEYATYEDVATLLLDGLLGRAPDRAELGRRLGRTRAEVFAHVGAIDDHLLALPPVDAMRALLARLPDGDDLETALRLLAAPPSSCRPSCACSAARPQSRQARRSPSPPTFSRCSMPACRARRRWQHSMPIW